MGLRLVQLSAIMLTALALVPSGAHLAALPNKVAMAQAAYFVAQQIYAGWALFGTVLFGALVANLAHAIVLRKLALELKLDRSGTTSEELRVERRQALRQVREWTQVRELLRRKRWRVDRVARQSAGEYGGDLLSDVERDRRLRLERGRCDVRSPDEVRQREQRGRRRKSWMSDLPC